MFVADFVDGSFAVICVVGFVCVVRFGRNVVGLVACATVWSYEAHLEEFSCSSFSFVVLYAVGLIRESD